MSEEKQQAHIGILRFPDNVRKRRGMYLSSPNQCIDEIIDNSVDEFLAGRCKKIAIAIVGDTITVEDDGGGIPITECKDPEFKGLSEAQVAMSTLHAGGKIGNESGYKTHTAGLNGVGASCTNAVSSTFDLIIYNNGKEYITKFEKGIAIVNTTPTDKEVPKDKTGTCIKFVLDKEIWGEETIDYTLLEHKVRQLAYLNPGLTLWLYLDVKDSLGRELKTFHEYCYPNGIKDYVNKLSNNKIKLTDIFTVNNTSNKDNTVSLAFTWTDTYSNDIKSFVNNINTVDGGDHLTGFKEGIAKAIISYAADNKYIKDKQDLTNDDTREGLIAVVSVSMKDPVFEGQNKHRMKSSVIRALIREDTAKYLYDVLDKNPDTAKVLIDKVLKASKARLAAKKAREAARGLKSISNTETGLPGKLADCTSKNPEECELFLVEGDSAGGSAKQARDRQYQAILPIFGKMLNVEKITADKVFNNIKFQDVIKALKTGINEDFDINRLRYHKIVLFSDADVDGGHIQCLYMAFFYRYMKKIIEQGYLYAACPPLFKVQKGKQCRYAYNDNELSTILDEFGKDNINVQRYKGLGEMNPDQLWETTMNPNTRRLVKITIKDAEQAEAILTACMGKDTTPRKKLILDREGVDVV